MGGAGPSNVVAATKDFTLCIGYPCGAVRPEESSVSRVPLPPPRQHIRSICMVEEYRRLM
jgi:hypothetical protein